MAHFIELDTKDDIPSLARKCNYNFKQLNYAADYDTKKRSKKVADDAQDALDQTAGEIRQETEEAIEEAVADKVRFSDLADVAFSGNYNDLENKPDLSIYAETEDLADVAFSGEYSDLRNAPSIPATVTYTLSKSGSTIKLTGSDGSESHVTDSNTNTTYTISKSGNTVTLTGSDGSSSSFTDSNTNTTYALSKSGSMIKLTGSDGSETSVTDSNTNTTYTLSKSGNSLKLTPSSGTADTVALSAVAFSGSAGDLSNLPDHYDLETGALIPNNADLNTNPGATIGTYYKSNNTNVATLTNCPVSKAFKMWVERTLSSSYVLQHIVTWDGAEYWWRYSTDGGSSWGAWYREAPRTTTGATANKFLATPNGSAGLPAYRSIVEADLIHTYQDSLYSHGVVGSYYDSFDRTKDTLSAAVNRRMFVGYDAGGRTIGAIRMYQNASSGFTTQIEAANQDSNGNLVTNYFNIRKDRDGEDHYGVQTPENFAFDLNMPYLAATPNHRIPANADLNAATYRTYGTYDCTANATVATLSNCPTEYAFKMFVFHSAYIQQFIIDYVGQCWMRLYNEGWGSWRKFAPTTLPNTTANRFLATPNGSTGYASYRAIALADLPNSASGNRWYVNAYVQSDGYMSIGKYLTFWGANTETKQFGQIYFYNTDKPGMYFYAYGTNGERKSALFFGGDNARFPQSGYPKANGTGWLWHFLKAPITLYDSSSGTAGTVTLAESAGSFNYLGIYYCTDNRNYRNYVEVYSPDGKTVNLLASENAQGGKSDLSLYLKSKAMLISGTSMTNTDFGGQAIVSHGDTGTYAYEYKYIKILRVVGFK